MNAPRAALPIVFGIIFLDMLGVGVLAPVMPYLVRKFRTDALTIGILALCFSAAQFFATPVLGVLSDRYGRRPILLISTLGTAVGYLIFGWANTLWLMFFSRVLAGATGGSISTAQAYIADISKPEDRGKNFGLIGAAFGLGFLLGPALGGLFKGYSPFVACALALLTTVVAYFFLPESLPPEKRPTTRVSLADLNPFRVIAQGLRNQVLRPYFAAAFAFNFAYSGLQSHFAIYALARFGVTEAQNALLITYLGLMAALVQGVLLRRLTPWLGERRLLHIGFWTSLAGFILLTLAPGPWWLYPALTLLPLGSGLAVPSLNGLMSQRVNAHEQGALMGVGNSLGSLARIAGPLWAGWTFDLIAPTAPYWTAALWIAVALVSSWLALKDASKLTSEAQAIP
jgi:multidrug resistance protein